MKFLRFLLLSATLVASALGQTAVRFNNATGAVTDPIKLPSTKAVINNSGLAAIASAGSAVYFNGSAWALSRADAQNTARVDAIVESISAPNVVVVYAGEIPLTGLTAGMTYYLSATTAGATVTTAPTTAGTYRVPLFTALSTTKAVVKISSDPASNNLLGSADIDPSIARMSDLAGLSTGSLPIGSPQEVASSIAPPTSFFRSGLYGTTAYTARSGYVDYVQGGTALAATTVDVAAGTYSGAQSVTIGGTAGSILKYTTDGNDPTWLTGSTFSSAISIAATTTLKHRQLRLAYPDGPVTATAYTINSASGIVQDNATGSAQASVSSITVNHSQGSLTNGYAVIVVVGSYWQAYTTTVTYGGVACTLISGTSNMYALPLGTATSGSKSVVATFDNTLYNARVAVVTFSGVAQATNFTSTLFTGYQNAVANDITSTASSELALGLCFDSGGNSVTVSESDTLLWKTNTNPALSFVKKTGAAGTLTFNWSFSASTNFAFNAVVLRAAP